MADPQSSSVQTVISNNDLLTEILVGLPPLSLILFKSVYWFSLIKDAANLTFRRNLDPPSGLFICKYTSYKKDEASFNYDFVPFDIRIPLLATNFTFGPEVHGDVLHSCNGLLLCCRLSGKLYVNNPSITNMFKVIPKPNNVTSFTGGLKMAFDPTKSPPYKVIFLEMVEGPDDNWVQIHTYSSQTGNWSLCGDQFSQRVPSTLYENHDIFWSLHSVQDGVYWNGAIYWLDYCSGRKFYKLDIMNEHPVVTALSRQPYIERLVMIVVCFSQLVVVCSLLVGVVLNPDMLLFMRRGMNILNGNGSTSLILMTL
ncbi:hypothetical protein Tco_1053445 [Tanacetum coccineum]